MDRPRFERSITMRSKVSARLNVGVALVAMVSQLAAGAADAFCGFYVAKADSKLFNRSSKVVLTRDGNHTAITMASDYEGDPKEFAVVIPVPTFIERKQIGVVDTATIDHLDAYTAPRLVEYSDPDPCLPIVAYRTRAMEFAPAAAPPSAVAARLKGVTVEASYDVGEYDVSILSANESNGLVEWLTDNGYRIPDGATTVLGSYIRQNMHFFIAKVNLGRMKLMGNHYLRPLQVRYETAKFMLPLRLGTVNANGPQDLIVYALTRKGRVEAANYRTVKLPTGMDIPLYVKAEFGKFYKAMFDRAVENENMRAVFVEYAWDMGWCEPLRQRTIGEQGAGRARCALDRGRWRRPVPRRRHARLRDAPARALRRKIVSRRHRVPGDLRPRELPGPLRVAPPVAGRGRLSGGPGLSRAIADEVRQGGDQSR
jgi:hypothetical protein